MPLPHSTVAINARNTLLLPHSAGEIAYSCSSSTVLTKDWQMHLVYVLLEYFKLSA